MSEKDPAVEIIKKFLSTRGYDPSRAEDGVQDGHWILATIDQLCSVCCRDSYEAGIRNVLEILERGEYCANNQESDWLLQSSVLVLERAGMR